MKRLITALAFSCIVGSAIAVTGANASGIIDVTETITADAGRFDYLFTFTNISASAPIYSFGAYVHSSGVSGLTGFGNTAFESFAQSGFAEAGYSSSDTAAEVFNDPQPSSNDIAIGQTGSISFTSTSDDVGGTVFFAEVEGHSATIPGGQSELEFSYVGNVT